MTIKGCVRPIRDGCHPFGGTFRLTSFGCAILLTYKKRVPIDFIFSGEAVRISRLTGHSLDCESADLVLIGLLTA
jgi:hypothetical protein